MTYTFLILCCWMVSFVFVGIEAGLLSIDPVRLRHHVKQRKPSALRLEALMKHPERLLITILLGYLALKGRAVIGSASVNHLKP